MIEIDLVMEAWLWARHGTHHHGGQNKLDKSPTRDDDPLFCLPHPPRTLVFSYTKRRSESFIVASDPPYKIV